MALSTLSLGNCGIIKYLGHAGFLLSAVGCRVEGLGWHLPTKGAGIVAPADNALQQSGAPGWQSRKGGNILFRV